MIAALAPGPRIVYLDTNVVLWLAQGKLDRIGKEAKRLIERSELLLSPMVLVELEYLFEIGRSKLPAQQVQLKIEYDLGTRFCDLPFMTVARVMTAEKWTRDPFDRMIVAQAKANGFAPLLSADEEIAVNYSRTVWH